MPHYRAPVPVSSGRAGNSCPNGSGMWHARPEWDPLVAQMSGPLQGGPSRAHPPMCAQERCQTCHNSNENVDAGFHRSAARRWLRPVKRRAHFGHGSETSPLLGSFTRKPPHLSRVAPVSRSQDAAVAAVNVTSPQPRTHQTSQRTCRCRRQRGPRQTARHRGVRP